MDRGVYIAHCVSGDFSLGAGLAKKIDEKYDMRYQLFRTYPFEEGSNTGYVGKALLIGDVFNLVTKEHRYDKVNLDDLRATLDDMLNQCEDKGIRKLAMPRIGTGHDHLDWNDVSELIEQVFFDSDVEVFICEL